MSGLSVFVAGAAAGATGNNGASSTFGALITAPGGGGGVLTGASSGAITSGLGSLSLPATVSGAASLLVNNYAGGPSFPGLAIPSSDTLLAPLGAGGYGGNIAYAQNVDPGGGAAGTINGASSAALAGYIGSSGIIIVYEYS